MGFPAVKIFCYFLFRQPYPRSFYPFHNSGNDFPVVAFMRLLSLFYPKAAVFFIKPCTDSFFLPLLQMSELLICPQQLPVYLFMIFLSRFLFSSLSISSRGNWGRASISFIVIYWRHEREARGLNQLEVIPVNFGASVPQEDAAANYADISTWMWSLVRDMAQSGRLHLPNDTELIAQLSTRKYAFAGTPPKLKLESKDIMKRRGLPSPDRADAVALSLYQPVTYTWEIG